MDWKALAKQVVPYLISAILGGSGFIGGKYQEKYNLQDSTKDATMIIVDQYRKSYEAQADALNKEFQARLRLCKETQGRVCK